MGFGYKFVKDKRLSPRFGNKLANFVDEND